MNQLLKIVIAIILLLCLADMPYAYYEFVRFASMVGFAYLAYDAFEHKNQRDLTIFIVLALLFQPFEKIALGRVLWNVVDVVVALYLLAGVLNSRKVS